MSVLRHNSFQGLNRTVAIIESALSYVIERIGPQGCVFASDFPHEIAMEDALHEINEILERKDINDKYKAMILGENAKRFYNL